MRRCRFDRAFGFILGNMTTSYVYTHDKLLPSGLWVPFYVGKGVGKRAFDYKGRSDWHKKVSSKYETRVTFWNQDLSDDSAIAKEVELIAFLKSEGIELVNLTEGGEGTLGYRHSDKEKIRRSAANSGHLNPMYGKTHTESAKKIISEASKKSGGQKKSWTDARRKKSSLTGKAVVGKYGPPMLNRTHSVLSREKMRMSHIGKVRKDETRAKIAAAFFGTKWISKDGVKKRVPIDMVSTFLNEGWNIGWGKR